MRVFLIHGMGRTPLSMLVLKWRLERSGHRVTLFGYLVTAETLETIAERFIERIERTLADDAADEGGPVPWAVVGHSLGSIVTRWASPRLPDGFERFVMLAPPNRSPAVAQALEGHWLFRTLTRDAGAKLADPTFYDTLPVPDVPSMIIAGTRGPRASWHPAGEHPNDCLVAVEETHLPGQPVLEIHAAHSFMMNRRDVFEAVRTFLEAPGPEPARAVPGLRFVDPAEGVA